MLLKRSFTKCIDFEWQPKYQSCFFADYSSNGSHFSHTKGVGSTFTQVKFNLALSVNRHRCA